MTSRAGGSGVGFAVTRQIVEQHGGRLLVRTTEGSGTLVSMCLPALARDGFALDPSRAASGS